MKKRFSTIIAILLAVLMIFSVGCAGGEDPSGGDGPGGGTTTSIRLRSDATQNMLVGEKFTVVYSTAPANAEVVCASDNESVVTVDKFATVTAVGPGQANVTIALKDDDSKYVTIGFNVKRNNFMITNGLFNGSVDFGHQEDGGDVLIKSGQAQILANAKGQQWYFKTHIDHNGFITPDAGGMWGVGSFLVDSGHPIGDTMFWYILQRADAEHLVRSFYGGWRYDTTIPDTHRETSISSEIYNTENGVDFTIIRNGVTHYVIAEFKTDDGYKSFKYAYDVTMFNGADSYPGVFSQNQILTVSDYSMSNDPEKVAAELAKFQLAERVEINGISQLVPGAYNLTSTVTPTFTIDKSVTYSIKEPVDGVTVNQNGTLTISQSAVGSSFTVVATAVSDTDVTGERTFTVIARGESTHNLFDTGMVLTVKDGGDARAVRYDADGVNSLRISARNADTGDAYVPLTYTGQNWYVTASIRNANAVSSAVNGTELGIMSADAGYMRYTKFGIQYMYGVEKNNMVYDVSDGDSMLFSECVNAHSSTVTNTIGLIKLGNTYYVEMNGRFVKKLSGTDGATSPVLYALRAGAFFTNVTLVTDEDDIRAYVASKKFYVGSYVTVEGDSYTLRAIDQGAPYAANEASDTLDWPPDNDYNNGIKSTRSFTGNFAIEFTMSNVKPLNLGGSYDAKVLVYLKSERTTASLQFVIKRDNAGVATQVTFTPNLDDATWTAYNLPSGVDILGGSTAVKVVRKADGVELYLNGTLVTTLTTTDGENRTVQASDLMANVGLWNDNTISTPGIGTFLCGVTITNPTFTAL